MMKKAIGVVLCIFLVFLMGCNAAYTPAAAVVPSPSPAPTPPPSLTAIRTAPPVSTPAPRPAPTRVTVMAAGDLLCLYAQLCAARKGGSYQFNYCFDRIRARVSSADLAIANFETLVVPGKSLTKALPKPPSPAPSGGADEGTQPFKHGNTRMNAPESYLSAVANCGFDVLTNANNHVADQKAAGIVSTLGLLDKYGIRHTGAYASKQDKKPLIVDVKGIQIAVLAYTSLMNNGLGKKNAFMVDRYKGSLVAANIAAAKAAGVDFVIVYMHWGQEGTHRVNSSQKKMAGFIANAGADMILGAHSHCTQPFASIETPRGRVPVIYSMGNFLSSMGQAMNRDAVLVSMVLEKDAGKGTTSLVELKYTPTYCANTKAGHFIILPADAQAVAGGSKTLAASRKRTLKVLSGKVATPE